MNILDQIITNTYTTTDLRHRLRLVKSFVEDSMFGKGEFMKTLDQEEQDWLQSLPKDFLSGFNSKNFYDQFKTLETETEKIIPLIIYLSFSPNPDTVVSISKAAREKFNPKIIIDFKIDPMIIGGCSLSWKGVYRDYSLKSVIQDKKQDLLSSFKKYMQ